MLLPPAGYLERLREICDKHGILLIFDEVITGFGRVGAPFAAQEFGVTPDMITTAKGLTNGVVPMGAVFAQRNIHDAFMQGPEGDRAVPRLHLFGEPPASCAAALATLDIYERERPVDASGTVARAEWEDAAHSLRGLPHVIDVRNYGLILGRRVGAAPGQARRARLRCLS